MKNSGRGKSIVVVLILIFLIIGIVAVGAYAYLMTDLFKTPEQLFKKYLLSNVLQLTQTNFEPFNEINERSETEVTQYLLEVGVDPTVLGGDESEKIDVDLKLTTDIPNRNEELELLINKGENEYLKGYLALTDETLGLKVPDLHDKYIAVENRDLKKIAETFNMPEEYLNMIPDKIPSSMTEEEKEKVEALTTKYITKITEQFDENSYIAEKNLTINVNSKEIVADRYTLAISSKTMYTTVTTAVKELLEDPDFLALCQDRITTDILDKLKTSYNDMLEQNPVEDIEDKTIKVSVYAADGATVKSEITVDESEVSVAIENNENESIIILSSIEPKSETNDVGTTTISILKNTYANNSGEFSYETTTEYNKDDIKTLQDEYDAQYSGYSSSFSRDYSEIYTDSSEKYIIKTSKTNESTITGKIEFDGEGVDAIKDALDISFKCQFGNATVNTIDESNSIVINDYTMEDYQKLVIDIGTNAAATAITKPDSLIGSFLSNSIMGNFTTDDNTYTSDDFVINSEEDTTGNYEDITLPEDANSDNYLYPTVSNSTEILRNDVDTAITDGLTAALNRYKMELEFNPEANLGDFLTVESVQQFCGDKYILELTDSTTIKCTINEESEQYIYYALMNIDGNELVVTEVEVLTEEEYLNR